MNFRKLVFSLLSLSIFLPALNAQEIKIAAASDLQFALPDIASQFEKETGKTVKLTFGSSGNFFAQLQNGAPFDLFFSANLDYPTKLEAAGLTEPGSFYRYATGKLVVWVLADSKLDISSGIKSLLDPAIKKVAIANPQHAPYGQAALAAMKNEQVYDQLAGKLVLGENISQTASFVVSGSADVGIVALALALGPNMKDKGRFVEVPPSDYPAIQQACVIMKSSREKVTARDFLQFLRRPQTKDLLRTYGFEVPAKDPQNK